jgi:PAS domain S-box-containing protein
MRHNSVAVYGIAVVLVAIATFVRWAVTGHVVAGPFVTYYPAIIIATLIGGFWCGILTIAISGLIGWYLFLPPDFSWTLTEQAASLLLFVFLASLNVAIVAMLNSAVVRLRAQAQNVRVLIENAPNGILVVDDQGTIKLLNAGTEKLFGYKRSELIGQSVEVLVPYGQIDDHLKLRNAFLQKPEARTMGAGRDLSGRRKDGSEVPIEVGLNPISQNGRHGVVASVIDISERVKAQAHQKFLVHELQHRTQNLFAVIQSIIARSLVKGQTVAQAKQVITGRLQALARTHAILAGAAWEGASLGEILKREFGQDFSRYVAVSGCDITVNAGAAHQFALIIHELTTNALKYGALSMPSGRISIVGNVERANGASQFSLLWSESGGPPVAKPTRKGFGSIILFEAAKQFGMDIDVKYAPKGLSYELRVPMQEITLPSESLVPPPSNIAL